MTHTCRMLVNTYMQRGLIISLLSFLASTTIGQSLTNTTFVAFDVETTGFSRRARVIEIAAVKFRGNTEIAAKTWLINPGVSIPSSAQAIHGISDAMVADSPRFPEVFSSFAAFAGDSMLLAHNASYDTRLLNQEIARLALPAPDNMVADTLRLSRIWFPDIKSHSLKSVVDHLGIVQEQKHRALSDARDVMRLFLAGTATMKEGATLKDIETAVTCPFRKSRVSKPQ
jgi:DNA polymerase-3 subunit alpha (Gram-positive type)